MIRPLAELTPGMVLLRDVRDISGRLLLASGKEIAQKHLTIFKAWGVTEAQVQVQELEPSPPMTGAPPEPLADSEQALKIESRLRERFRFAGLDHPMLAELFAYRLAQEIQRDAGGGNA